MKFLHWVFWFKFSWYVLTVLLNDGRFRERNIQTWFDYLLKTRSIVPRDHVTESMFIIVYLRQFNNNLLSTCWTCGHYHTRIWSEFQHDMESTRIIDMLLVVEKCYMYDTQSTVLSKVENYCCKLIIKCIASCL